MDEPELPVEAAGGGGISRLSSFAIGSESPQLWWLGAIFEISPFHNELVSDVAETLSESRDLTRMHTPSTAAAGPGHGVNSTGPGIALG